MEFISKKIEDIVVSIKTGKTPNTKEPLYFEGDIPFVTPVDLKGQMFITDSLRKVSDLAIIENQSFLHEEKSILISTIGEIAKTGMVRSPLASNQQITGVLVNEEIIDPHFFYYWVKNNKDLLSYKANKAVIPILNNKVLKNITINFPSSLEFQRKVVEQLNMIQSLIDRRINTIKILDELIESIYYKEFGDVVNNQKEFSKKKLGKLTKKHRPITRGIENPGLNVNEGVEIIKTSDLYNGKIKTENLTKTSNQISTQFSRSICTEGDLLLTIRATVGECAKVTKKHEGANITRGIALISPDDKIVLSDYLLHAFLSNGFKFVLDQKVKGVTFKQINLIDLKEIYIPIPDINLQLKFVRKKKDIDRVKYDLQESLKLFTALFQSILQNAFKKDAVIDEEPIFKELIKNFTLEDLKENKKRLQLLINLFDSKEFDDLDDYSDAKEKLFQLIEEDQIIQELTNNNLKLKVK
ncbi:restriction endonuclease subunit S [Gaetbulibacter sp. PBL-D1]|uniref:restriction endonuclease subunit S n=1 Tax=Gaetbulibacter sp. PBL-D1 TaxID=3422594 RepID=UPI003D2EF591